MLIYADQHRAQGRDHRKLQRFLAIGGSLIDQLQRVLQHLARFGERRLCRSFLPAATKAAMASSIMPERSAWLASAAEPIQGAIAILRHQPEDAAMHRLARLAQEARIDRPLDKRMAEGESGIARDAVAQHDAGVAQSTQCLQDALGIDVGQDAAEQRIVDIAAEHRGIAGDLLGRTQIGESRRQDVLESIRARRSRPRVSTSAAALRSRSSTGRILRRRADCRQ